MDSKIAVIVSKRDVAGKNIARVLIEKFNFKKSLEVFDSNPSNPVFKKENFFLHYINGEQIFADYVDKIGADLFIFASKHKSAESRPSFTVHAVGNFSEAKFGGKPSTLVPINANILTQMFLLLHQKVSLTDISWSVSLEATHHGPFLSKPTVFIEIGSSLKEWNNQIACTKIAETIISTFEKPIPEKTVAIGIGDTHYCPTFSKLLLKNNSISLGHIIPKYHCSNLSFLAFKEAVEKTLPHPTLALFDWKSIRADYRSNIISYCNEIGLEYKRVKEVAL